MADRTTIIMQSSFEFKEAVATYAQRNNVSVAEVIREAVAAVIGYDLSKDSISSGRPRTYANAEERKKAQSDRQKKKRAVAAQFLEDYERAQRRGDVKTLEEYIAKRVAMGKTAPFEE